MWYISGTITPPFATPTVGYLRRPPLGSLWLPSLGERHHDISCDDAIDSYITVPLLPLPLKLLLVRIQQPSDFIFRKFCRSPYAALQKLSPYSLYYPGNSTFVFSQFYFFQLLDKPSSQVSSLLPPWFSNQYYCSSTFHGVSPPQALALSASLFAHKFLCFLIPRRMGSKINFKLTILPLFPRVSF